MLSILVLAAVIPAVWLLIQVYQEDRLEKESPRLLLNLILVGIVSTALAGMAERLGISLLASFLPENSLLFNILLYFLVVGLAEEGFKYLVLYRRTWFSSEFNCQFDGVVYAVFVSLGFALWENIGYVFQYGLATAAVRAVTAVPGHACFGVFMGVWYGIAKKYDLAGDPAKSRQFRRYAVLIPMFLHGLYDFLATYTQSLFSLVFVAFIEVMFYVSFHMVKKASKHDIYIVPNRYDDIFYS